jgi:protein-disulfide isomerase
MLSFFTSRPRLRRPATYLLSLTVGALFVATAVSAQYNPAPAPAHSNAILTPPAGARVAIVEFGDLECPACAHANPILKEAAAKYKIPWVRHDFLIPNHIWSPTAALNARWFDTKSKALGDEYRDEVFASQASIYNLNALRSFTDKFCASHHVALPFAVDPQGTLRGLMDADKALGERLGINATPSIWVVTANSKGAPYIEVRNVEQELYRIIDQALADTAQAARPAAKKATAK